VLEVQFSVKVIISEGVEGTKGSVTVAVPLVAFDPGQPSPLPPSEAVQLVALLEDHVNVVDCPEVNEVGEAVRVAVTGGHVYTTSASTFNAKGIPVHVSTYLYVPAVAGLTDWLPVAATLPLQDGSLLEPVPML